MGPAEAFKMAREAQNFVYFACFFHEDVLYMCKKLISFWLLKIQKKIVWPVMLFELFTPDGRQ
jgi:hypothetical protein